MIFIPYQNKSDIHRKYNNVIFSVEMHVKKTKLKQTTKFFVEWGISLHIVPVAICHYIVTLA